MDKDTLKFKVEVFSLLKDEPSFSEKVMATLLKKNKAKKSSAVKAWSRLLQFILLEN